MNIRTLGPTIYWESGQQIIQNFITNPIEYKFECRNECIEALDHSESQLECQNGIVFCFLI